MSSHPLLPIEQDTARKLLQLQSTSITCHIDLDCFYVAVERKANPFLRGRPVGLAQWAQQLPSNYTRSFAEERVLGAPGGPPLFGPPRGVNQYSGQGSGSNSNSIYSDSSRIIPTGGVINSNINSKNDHGIGPVDFDDGFGNSGMTQAWKGWAKGQKGKKGSGKGWNNNNSGGGGGNDRGWNENSDRGFGSSANILALSYEAKAAGVTRGMTIAEALRVCPECIFVGIPVTRGKADTSVYNDSGYEVMNILVEFGAVEKVSIDEAYVDLSGRSGEGFEEWWKGIGGKKLVEGEVKRRGEWKKMKEEGNLDTDKTKPVIPGTGVLRILMNDFYHFQRSIGEGRLSVIGEPTLNWGNIAKGVTVPNTTTTNENTDDKKLNNTADVAAAASSSASTTLASLLAEQHLQKAKKEAERKGKNINDIEKLASTKNKIRSAYRYYNAMRICYTIQERVKKELNLSCSLGVSVTKCVAKISSGKHKPFKLSLVFPSGILPFMSGLKIKTLRGYGQKLGKDICEKLKVELVGEILKKTSQNIDLKLKNRKMTDALIDSCHGIDNNPVEARLLKKNIGSSKRLHTPHYLTDRKTQGWLNMLFDDMSERIQKEKIVNGRRPLQIVVSYDSKDDNRSKTISIEEFTRRYVEEKVLFGKDPFYHLGFSAQKWMEVPREEGGGVGIADKKKSRSDSKDMRICDCETSSDEGEEEGNHSADEGVEDVEMPQASSTVIAETVTPNLEKYPADDHDVNMDSINSIPNDTLPQKLETPSAVPSSPNHGSPRKPEIPSPVIGFSQDISHLQDDNFIGDITRKKVMLSPPQQGNLNFNINSVGEILQKKDRQKISLIEMEDDMDYTVAQQRLKKREEAGKIAKAPPKTAIDVTQLLASESSDEDAVAGGNQDTAMGDQDNVMENQAESPEESSDLGMFDERHLTKHNPNPKSDSESEGLIMVESDSDSSAHLPKQEIVAPPSPKQVAANVAAVADSTSPEDNSSAGADSVMDVDTPTATVYNYDTKFFNQRTLFQKMIRYEEQLFSGIHGGCWSDVGSRNSSLVVDSPQALAKRRSQEKSRLSNGGKLKIVKELADLNSQKCFMKDMAWLENEIQKCIRRDGWNKRSRIRGSGFLKEDLQFFMGGFEKVELGDVYKEVELENQSSSGSEDTNVSSSQPENGLQPSLFALLNEEKDLKDTRASVRSTKTGKPFTKEQMEKEKEKQRKREEREEKKEKKRLEDEKKQELEEAWFKKVDAVVAWNKEEEKRDWEEWRLQSAAAATSSSISNDENLGNNADVNTADDVFLPTGAGNQSPGRIVERDPKLKFYRSNKEIEKEALKLSRGRNIFSPEKEMRPLSPHRVNNESILGGENIPDGTDAGDKSPDSNDDMSVEDVTNKDSPANRKIDAASFTSGLFATLNQEATIQPSSTFFSSKSNLTVKQMGSKKFKNKQLQEQGLLDGEFGEMADVIGGGNSAGLGGSNNGASSSSSSAGGFLDIEFDSNGEPIINNGNTKGKAGGKKTKQPKPPKPPKIPKAKPKATSSKRGSGKSANSASDDMDEASEDDAPIPEEINIMDLARDSSGPPKKKKRKKDSENETGEKRITKKQHRENLQAKQPKIGDFLNGTSSSFGFNSSSDNLNQQNFGNMNNFNSSSSSSSGGFGGATSSSSRQPRQPNNNISLFRNLATNASKHDEPIEVIELSDSED